MSGGGYKNAKKWKTIVFRFLFLVVCAELYICSNSVEYFCCFTHVPRSREHTFVMPASNSVAFPQVKPMIRFVRDIFLLDFGPDDVARFISGVVVCRSTFGVAVALVGARVQTLLVVTTVASRYQVCGVLVVEFREPSVEICNKEEGIGRSEF